MDLKLLLNIYKNGEKINTFTKERGAAALELAAALSYKISKNCKRSTIKKEAGGEVLKIAILFDKGQHKIESGAGACLIYKYEYIFTGDALRSLSVGL